MNAAAVPYAAGDEAEEGEIFPDYDELWLPLLRRPLIAVPTGAGALAAGLLGFTANTGRGVLVAGLFALLAAVLVVLAVIDAITMRLPREIVLPLYPVLGLGVLAAAGAGQISWAAVLTAFAYLAGAVVAFWLLCAFTGAIGVGDVLLAGPMALVLALVDGYAPVLGVVLLPVMTGGLKGVVMLLRGHGGDTAFAFGPFMASGGLLVMLFPTTVVPLFEGNLF